MQAAQKLYEGVDIGGETVGLITYMRTDGVASAPEALVEAREVIGALYGKPYVPETPRYYKVKAKNAQEAHEAIRPTSLGRNPGSLRLEGDLGRLYELIWKRMIASQMEAPHRAHGRSTWRAPTARPALRATGQVVLFPGYLAVYEEGRDDTRTTRTRTAAACRSSTRARPAKVIAARADQHFTEPPPRYSEASLVKKMEELGIGRPSTYASILTVLRDREYVRMDKNRFIPEDKGRLVTAFLEQFFKRYVEYDFTAALEEKLDLVSAGELTGRRCCATSGRTSTPPIGEIAELRVTNVLDALNEALGPHIFPPKGDGSDPRICPTCGTGRLSAEDRQVRGLHRLLQLSRMPLHPPARPVRGEDGGAESGDRELGLDPETGGAVWLKTGRFGAYVEMVAGWPREGEKPKRASLPKGWPPATMDLDKGLRLLNAAA
jgi:DNA topoisomerase-1